MPFHSTPIHSARAKITGDLGGRGSVADVVLAFAGADTVRSMQLYIGKCIPEGETVACDLFLCLSFTPPHGQPRAVVGGFISSSGGWILLCRKSIMAEKSSHNCVQRVATFYCSLCVLVGVNML